MANEPATEASNPPSHATSCGSYPATVCSAPRIPKTHAKHGKIPCGCWTGSGPAVSCKLCGASYDPMEVMEFPGWGCYDCGQGSWPANINFKPNPTGHILRSNNCAPGCSTPNSET